MNMLNSVILEGNVHSVGELNHKSNSLEFTVCSKRTYSKSDGTAADENTYCKVVCYGNMAETVYSRCGSGKVSGVRIVGRLVQCFSTDAETGKKSSEVKICAERIEFKAPK